MMKAKEKKKEEEIKDQHLKIDDQAADYGKNSKVIQGLENILKKKKK